MFRRPVPVLAVDYLLEPFAPGLDVPGIIRRLTRTNIVSVDRATKTVTLHPIDQDYAYSQLPEGGAGEPAYTRQALERRAANYYASIRKPESEWKTIDDLEPQLNEFEHRVRAGDYDGACRVLEPIDFDYLYLWGHYGRLVEMREKLLSRLTDPRLQASNLGSLGRARYALGQVRRAIKLYEEALAIAHEIGDRREEGVELGNLGRAHHDVARFERAIKLCEEALAIAREIGDRVEEGRHLGNLGLAYRNLGQVERAIEFHKQALTIARETGNRRRESHHLGDLGIAYRDLGQVEQAIKCHEQALTITHEIRHRRYESVWLGNLGNAYRDLGQIERAIRLYEEAMAIAHEIGDYAGEGRHLGNLGIAYRALGQFERAVKFYGRSLVIAREIGDRRREGVRLCRLGDAYHDLGQVERAVKFYEQSLAIACEIGDRRGESRRLLGLGQALLTAERLAEARRHSTEARDLNVIETSYRAALALGIVLLHQNDPATGDTFADAVARCQALLDKTAGLYAPRYALAAAMVGQAVCDPRWVEESGRTELLAPALEEYRRALKNCSAPGVVQDALRDLELIRAAGIEGLEPVFELLESGEKASDAPGSGGRLCSL